MVTTRSITRRRAALASAEKIADSEDLVIAILLRLPAKSLLKFKLVSTQWLSLISDPYFVRSHTRLLRTNCSLKPEALFFEVILKNLPTKFTSLRLNADNKPLPKLDFVDYPCVRIIQACNGLFLCVAKPNNAFGNSFSTLSYFICNPFLKKSKTIPFPIVKNYKHVGLNIAFDPLQSPHYKILSFWRQNKVYKYSIDVYSSENNTWSTKKFEFISTRGLLIGGAVFLNHAIHWDSFDKESYYYDLNNDCLKKIPMPTISSVPVSHGSPNFDRYFGSSGGRLHIVNAIGFSHFEFMVHEMLTNRSNWYIKHIVKVGAHRYVNIPRCVEDQLRTCLKYCAFLADEDEGDSVIIGLPMGKAISYNTRTRRVKRLECSNIDQIRADNKRYYGFYYFETLSWPIEGGSISSIEGEIGN